MINIVFLILRYSVDEQGNELFILLDCFYDEKYKYLRDLIVPALIYNNLVSEEKRLSIIEKSGLVYGEMIVKLLERCFTDRSLSLRFPAGYSGYAEEDKALYMLKCLHKKPTVSLRQSAVSIFSGAQPRQCCYQLLGDKFDKTFFIQLANMAGVTFKEVHDCLVSYDCESKGVGFCDLKI